MQTLVTTASVVSLLIVLAFGIVLLYRHPAIGLWVAGSAIVYDTLYGFDVTAVGETPSLHLFNLNIYLMDGIAVLFLCYAAVRITIDRRIWNVALGMLAGQLVAVLTSIAIGAQMFGLQNAGNNGRLYLWLLAVAAYTACVPMELPLLHHLSRVLAWSSIALLIIASVRWILISRGMLSMQYTETVSGETLRVLNAAQTLLLANAAVLAWYARRTPPCFRIPAVEGVLLVAVIVLQHRTVWIAVIGTVLWLLYHDQGLRTLVMRGLGLAIMFGGLAAAIWLPGRLAQSLAASAKDDSSLMWRVDGWNELLSRERYTAVNYVLGHPIGSDYTRGVAGRTTSVQAHNHYVQTFYDFGSSGIIFTLCFYWLVLRTFLRPSGTAISRSPADNAIPALLVMQLLSFLTYSPAFGQGLFIGLAIWNHGRSTRATTRQFRFRHPRAICDRAPLAGAGNILPAA